jgi:septal ring factor EnvC (AmiA/AmiB activator)
MQLRPVAFNYKPEYDRSGEQQYGLIAEEVAEKDPNLVAYDQDGQTLTVHYDRVNALMLNEVQRLHHENEAQNNFIAAQQDEQARLRQQTEAQNSLIAAQKDELQQLRHENDAARADIAAVLKRLDETEARLRSLEKHNVTP